MKRNLKRLTFAAVLGALGIVIPLFMPKIVIGDASYTLASHVPLFIAIFIGPDVAFLVGIATTTGFFLALTPIIAARAFSHLLWAIPAAFIFKKYKDSIYKAKYSILANIIIGFFHALFECLIVMLFYVGKPSEINSILTTIFIPIGIGGFIHSLVDFQISILVYSRINVHIEEQLLETKPKKYKRT